MGPREATDRAQRRRERTRRNRRRLRRGAYLLPSLFTIGNMLLGFYAVVMALRGSRVVVTEAADAYFVRAALAIFIAGILDTLDGRIARMTGTDSEFGREYDSLADLFTFGAAPALMTHVWGLDSFGRIGWLVPLYYMVCTATRLARFNVQTKVLDSRYFVGLPSPAAAGSVCSLLFFVPGPEWRDLWGVLVFGSLIVAGTLEVTTFRYWSLKQIDFKRRWSYRAALPLALIILVIALEPRAFFLVVAVVYAGSGPVTWLVGRLRRGGDGDGSEASTPSSDPDTEPDPASPEEP
jgi:CDP-diacylglycerol--serine O-phosphatidyltransferase